MQTQLTNKANHNKNDIGYSQTMAQPQSSSGQPPPSPVVYPQGMMQGNVQSAPPSRPIYATSSQQMSAPQHASMPAGQYPSSYYPAPPAPPPKGQPAAYPPQSPMYRQSVCFFRLPFIFLVYCRCY